MSTRHSRSASIPIPPSSVARSLESIIPISFNPSAPRPRLVSAGTSTSPTFARSVPHPSRSVSASYASAASPRGRPGPSPASTFEPRIIRAAPSPNPSREAPCNPPYSPAASPTRPRRLSTGIRNQGLHAGTPTHRASVHIHASQPPAQGFSRPPYLDYSSLRDMLHSEATPPTLTATARPAYSMTTHDTRSSASPAPPVIYPYLRRELTPVVDSDDESVATPAPPTMGAVTIISTNTVLMLPTRWSEQDRGASLSVSPDGRELSFTGPSCTGDRDSHAARTNHPVPPACGIYYYEVQIIHKCPQGPISIGFSARDVRLSRLPGWEKSSWGYHADDGYSYPGQKEGNGYGPKFDTGDIIGCGIDFSQNRMFYTKNGTFLGMVFENVGKTTEIFPSVGMRQTNEAVRANFGSSPFKFAIEEHIRARRDAVWGGIMNTPIDWSLVGLDSRSEDKDKPGSARTLEKAVMEDEDTREPLRKLVLAYLAHHGYARTARAFQAQCAERSRVASDGAPIQAKLEPVEDDIKMAIDDAPAVASAPDPPRERERGFDDELNTRLTITNAILRGDVDAALELIRAHHATVLEREQGIILFRLRCRKFVELVLAAGEALRRVKEAERSAPATPPPLAADEVVGPMDGVGAMDVDEPSPEAHPASSNPTTEALAATARASLHTALAFGQTLEADYKTDGRLNVRAHLRRTFGVVAYDDPIAAGGEVAETAGQAARNALAAEVNQAILESQGRPAHPALETLFRQAGACVTQLGLLGVGAAAFADVRREFIEG